MNYRVQLRILIASKSFIDEKVQSLHNSVTEPLVRIATFVPITLRARLSFGVDALVKYVSSESV